VTRGVVADDAADGTGDDADPGEAVLLDVLTTWGQYAVAALADVPLHRLAPALAQLLGGNHDSDHGYDLVGDGDPDWDPTRTLRELGVAHASVVRLVPRAPVQGG
jgi:hypothetical protein